MAIKIILIDEHLMFLEALGALISEKEEFQVVGTFESSTVAFEVLADLQPEVVVLGVNVSAAYGCEACRLMTESWPDLKVLGLSAHDHKEAILDLLKAGARGYLTKFSSSSELLQAIEVIYSGDIYLSPKITRHVLSGLESDLQPRTQPPGGLTPREIEVVRLIAEGGNTKQIAWKLSISNKTVESHRSNIMNKLGLENVAGLVHYALREGLLPTVKDLK